MLLKAFCRARLASAARVLIGIFFFISGGTKLLVSAQFRSMELTMAQSHIPFPHASAVAVARNRPSVGCGTNTIKPQLYFAFMTHRGERPSQRCWKTLIDEDLHFPKRASMSAFASSRAAMACSRLTPGYCSRNSSRVSPPSK